MSFISRNHPQQVATRGPLDEIDDRGTPQDLWDELNAKHNFTLDVAAAHHNTKTEHYYTRLENGLNQEWRGSVWCNPPYSGLSDWLRKAWEEWLSGHARTIVMLLPANRCEQPWWHDHVEPFRDRPSSPLTVKFLAGRLRFVQAGATEVKPNERPPFGCVVLTWAGDR